MSSYTAHTAAGTRHASRGWTKPYGPVWPPDGPAFVPRSGRLSLLQALGVARERVVWNRRAQDWDDAGSTGLTEVVAEVLRAARASVSAGGVAVDLGAGSGQVTIPLAENCDRVLAVDVSARLLERLRTKASASGITNVECLIHPIESLDLASESIDLVVSNYALHHLRDVDKDRLLNRCYAWLRPGGHVVICDMMFGRGSDSTDRAIIVSKVRTLLRRGPGGWWRLLKNIVRFSLRVREKPLPPAMWETVVRNAGFQQVSVRRIVSEACVLTARRPHSGSPIVERHATDPLDARRHSGAGEVCDPNG